MSYILLAIVKIFDNIIGTAKSIATFKEQKILSSILVVVSQLIFYTVISQIINDKTILSIVIVSISSGIGNYLAFLMNDKFKKDNKWTIMLTSSNIDDVNEFRKYLSNANIQYVTCSGKDEYDNDTFNIFAISKNKEQSRIISNYVKNSDNDYFKEVI